MRPSAVIAFKEDEPSVGVLANQAMADSGGDIKKAAANLERLAAANPPIWFALTENLLSRACYDAVRGVCRQSRRAIWTAPNYDKGGNSDRLKSFSVSIMDWPLPGGMLLRNANKEDVLKAAGFYSTQAKSMSSVAAWLMLIGKRVGKVTVGEKFTAEKLGKLQELV